MAHEEHAIPEVPTHQEVASDVLARYRDISPRYRSWVLILALLTAIGVVGVVIRLSQGFDDRSNWGYFTATLAFILTTFMAMPAASAGFRLAKNNWRRPLTRITENVAVVGVFAWILVIIGVQTLPPTEGRPSIWFDFPHWMAFRGGNIMIWGTLALIGVVLMWMLALPDLAAVRDAMPDTRRGRIARVLSFGWIGNLRQWRVLYMGALIIGATYLLLYPTVQTLMNGDFQQGLTPGMKDAIRPATATVYGLQGGTAMIIVIMYAMRRFGGYERYLGIDQFWSLSKPLLAFSLLWFYFWWCSFIVYWYGRQPGESEVLRLYVTHSYTIPLAISMLCNFIIPLVSLVWNPVRRSIWGPTMVASSILFGCFINCLRWYVGAFSIQDPSQHVIDPLPGAQWPGIPDIMIVVGCLSACVLLFMLINKLIPPISMWEVGEGLRLVKVRRFLARYAMVIGKSH